MKRFLSTFIALALSTVMLAGCGSASSSTASTDGAKSDKTYNIGVIQYTEHPALDAAREGFIEALKEGGYSIFYFSYQGMSFLKNLIKSKRLIFRYYQKNIRLLFSSRSTLTIHI